MAAPLLQVSASYYGETISHPGLALNVGYLFPITDWYHTGIIGTVAGYTHPRNHTALCVSAGIGNHLQIFNRVGMDLNITGGLFGRIPAGDVYTAPDLIEPWYDAIMYNPALQVDSSISITVSESATDRFEALLGLSLFGETQYNGYLLPHISTTVGMKYSGRGDAE